MFFTKPVTAGLIGGGLVAGLALAALYFRLDPAQYPFPRCPVHWLTGLHCPGCGTQRALHALLHGEIEQAVSFNLLAALFAPVLLLGAVEEVRGRIGGIPRRSSVLYRAWFGWSVVAASILFTVLRNLPGPLGNWLAP
ncbi:DUF2752 domain-containing protein [Hymenobacter sp. BT186]|uniref:DUF2752 domain-containing protein n=1 Tax=Hymenobacter telluris TaxID=2816474 RepID=A0A939JBR5_9BACT|nr:DUF2752 domain-containing protein [Hymenobacter telluris]MBO0359426.1 DUF2752 domain-containing protein [Hymenobacter telluris]